MRLSLLSILILFALNLIQAYVGKLRNHTRAEVADIAEHEQLCVRRIDAVARLRLTDDDPSLMAAWSVAIADALATAIADGRGVVRYGSRAHALVDLIAGVAASDLSRAWAWRMLGLWGDDDGVTPARGAELCVDALCSEPSAITAVLREAARSGALAALRPRIGPRGFIALARAALSACSLAPDLVAASADAPAPTPAALREAERIARSSPIAPIACVEIRPAAHRALAVLAALDVEPGSLRGPDAAVRALIEALVTTALSAASPAASVARAATHDERDVHAVRGLADPEERPLPRVRRRGGTRMAGVLFLLHIVAELDLPREILTVAPLDMRPLRWSLHAIAMSLALMEPRDPAALAFAGLGPNDDPPSRNAAPPTDAERDAVAAITARIAARLRERLRRDEPAATVLREVILRRAEIVADPGWLEVRLSLDDVHTDIRRAALDLDPGWIPWLGAIVRFVYG